MSCDCIAKVPRLYWIKRKMRLAAMHILCTTECRSSTREVITTALYCKHLIYLPWRAESKSISLKWSDCMLSYLLVAYQHIATSSWKAKSHQSTPLPEIEQRLFLHLCMFYQGILMYLQTIVTAVYQLLPMSKRYILLGIISIASQPIG